MNPRTHFHESNFGRTIPARNREDFQFHMMPSADHIMSKAMSVNMPITNPMDQQLMHLAYQQSARAQKIQIDAAIRLLQMEYDTIMARMAHQTPMDRIHQEALGAVQTIAMLGSNVPKMSAPSCPQQSYRAGSTCSSDNDRVTDFSCSQERKRHRDEDEVSEQDVEAAHPSGHG